MAGMPRKKETVFDFGVTMGTRRTQVRMHIFYVRQGKKNISFITLALRQVYTFIFQTTMKLSLASFALCVASASAFAPAANQRVSTL